MEARHPIRVVARRTGIGLHVLRAWERRYAAVQPIRTDGKQRLYSDADIARLRLLKEAVDAGHSISQLAKLDDAQLGDLLGQARSHPPSTLASDPSAEDLTRYRDACLAAAERMDDERIHRLLMRALLSARPTDFIDSLVVPLLEEVGRRWHVGRLSPAHEHAVSIAVRRSLEFLLAAYEPAPDAPTFVATTLSGDPHEFGAMISAVAAGAAGWRVLYLGPSLPSDEIARAASVSGALAVGVSAVHDVPPERLVKELTDLRAALPSRVRVFAGGHAVHRMASTLAGVDGLEPVTLAELRDSLRRDGVEVGG
jgi:DNA-binding transcriptional MerR regulator/methylmalonyl-CoA mutase cobalamin-binding subunit